MEALKSRLGGSDLSSYVCNAEDCVRFKFGRQIIRTLKWL